MIFPSTISRNLFLLVLECITLISEVGAVIEYRDRFELMQLSYCFMASVKKNLEAPSFTEGEQSNGFILKWVTFDEAINLFQNDKPTDYSGCFIKKRDYTFLIKAKDMLT